MIVQMRSVLTIYNGMKAIEYGFEVFHKNDKQRYREMPIKEK